LPGPTLELLYDDEGPLWQITYSGMTRQHRQSWQAWWYYEWAQALYAVAQLAEAD
jgi:hypothetical protein